MHVHWDCQISWDAKLVKNMRKSDFSEMCLPGVEIVPRPRGSILHATRASQRPYSAKSDFSSKLYIFVDFLLFPLLFPLKGPIGPGDHP